MYDEQVTENELRKRRESSTSICDHDLLNAIEAASLEADSTSSSESDLTAHLSKDGKGIKKDFLG